ncbi:hypothetical protein DM02DRAFT_164821 [Periconia macrospinosa]|uniref:Fungal N-terminal domain-containing protein n=1 Tax=Periconia macrospinosa TaxID=97972 RepID=A0A2V1DAZ5_9PLEO|nr:hypothetical protein DM02DRAFT_164821 [Periconia macrospinosa]
MDPLSITASILTVLATAGAVLKELEHLRSRMNPDAEFLTLMNSVTDLQATLIIVRDCADTLKNSKAPAAQQSYRDLPYAIDKVQAPLDRLVDFIRGSLLRKGNRKSRLSLSESKKRKLSELRGSVSEAHQHLQLILLSANLLRDTYLYCFLI